MNPVIRLNFRTEHRERTRGRCLFSFEFRHRCWQWGGKGGPSWRGRDAMAEGAAVASGTEEADARRQLHVSSPDVKALVSRLAPPSPSPGRLLPSPPSPPTASRLDTQADPSVLALLCRLVRLLVGVVGCAAHDCLRVGLRLHVHPRPARCGWDDPVGWSSRGYAVVACVLLVGRGLAWVARRRSGSTAVGRGHFRGEVFAQCGLDTRHCFVPTTRPLAGGLSFFAKPARVGDCGPAASDPPGWDQRLSGFGGDVHYRVWARHDAGYVGVH